MKSKIFKNRTPKQIIRDIIQRAEDEELMDKGLLLDDRPKVDMLNVEFIDGGLCKNGVNKGV